MRAMSMVLVITCFWAGLWAGLGHAHETQPAIANVTVGPATVEMAISLNAEALIAGVDQSRFSDTNDAPEAEEYDRLRALEGPVLADLIAESWPMLASGVTLEGAGDVTLSSAEVMPSASEELARETNVVLSAPLDPGVEGVRLGWAAEYGTLILRQERDGDVYAALLQGGELSELLPVTGVAQETAGETFWRFLVEGFEHIIPKGLDHILFVLGLFFFALRWSPILWQVTAFTVAHTITLALATLEVITIPEEWMWLVEAFIALSITYVAAENILRPRLGWWRPMVVFLFGLLHGLGFASVLGDLGLAQGQFIVSLVAFNIGVEIGQLAVILCAFLLIIAGVYAARIARLDDPEEEMVRDLPEMYRANAIVGSLIIGIIGAYWFVERALL
ncbi:MAG: HupE/UreJ family protein [Pseudomonadota bacterium]